MEVPLEGTEVGSWNQDLCQMGCQEGDLVVQVVVEVFLHTIL